MLDRQPRIIDFERAVYRHEVERSWDGDGDGDGAKEWASRCQEEMGRVRDLLRVI